MDNSRPKVSIGMPVYNGGQHIRQALDLLLAQDYQGFELIISDNASTDDTQRLCLDYSARDKRIRYYRSKENKGAIWNFNQAFMLSQGEYFMWASCHDSWEPSYVSRCAEVLKQEPAVVLCYSLADWIDVDGKSLKVILRGPDSRGLDRISRCHVTLWGMQYGCPIYGLIKADVLKQTNILTKGIGPDIRLLFELSFFGEFAQIPEVLLHIRRMPDFGSWDAYIYKTFCKSIRGLRRRWLFWGMLFKYLSTVNRHIRNIPARFLLMFSTSLCILVKYRWIRRGLVEKRSKFEKINPTI